MVRIVIPSLDRPAQLELLLRSLRENWIIEDWCDEQLEIKVLCKWSNQKFWDGYKKVAESFPNVVFAKEESFCNQIKDWIDMAGDVVGFLTDDCVMYRKPPTQPSEISCILHYPNAISFSLRLSPYTIVQDYLTGELQPELQYGRIGGSIIHWKWNRYSPQLNWGYIFSLDGCFYDKQWLWNLVKDKQFNLPRALEYQLSIDPALRDTNKPCMTSCMLSSVFVNTINCVQPGGPVAGTKYPYSTEMLNEKFLSGQRISLDSFANQPIISCHEEFPLMWSSINDN